MNNNSVMDRLGGLALDANALGSGSSVNSRTENIDEDTLIDGFFKAEDVKRLAKESLDFLAGLVLPGIFKYLFPDTLQKAWGLIIGLAHKQRDFSQLVLGIPRGFAKTTFIKLVIIYIILFTNKHFGFIACETQQKANNIVADVMKMLSVINIIRAFGDWRAAVEIDRQDLKKFAFRGRVIVLMAGTVFTARGANLENARPDFMIFDDIQSRTCADSEPESQTLEREFLGTAMKAKSPHGCLFIFVANMYPTKHSILRKLKYNPSWIKFIAGGIIVNSSTGISESLWEELHPLEQLLNEFENDMAAGHPEIFYAEVLNDENAAINNIIDFSKVPEWRIQEGDICAGNFVVIDPAGYKKNSDANSIGYFEIHDGIPALMSYIEGKFSPGEVIRKTLTLALQNNCRCIVVESNGYQSSLCYWFEFICQQLQLQGIEVLEIHSGAQNKNSRLISMLRGYVRGEVLVHPDYRSGIHVQMSQFNPLKRDNTDGLLDLLAYAPRILQEFGTYISSLGVIIDQEYQFLEVQEFNSPF